MKNGIDFLPCFSKQKVKALGKKNLVISRVYKIVLSDKQVTAVTTVFLSFYKVFRPLK